jgi:uncharacterized membrane protein YccF (DUF307 family)
MRLFSANISFSPFANVVDALGIAPSSSVLQTDADLSQLNVLLDFGFWILDFGFWICVFNPKSKI